MRSLVTGGAGFIGSHLVDRLIGDGHDVIVIDNFASGGPRNLTTHEGNARLTMVEADVADYERIAPHFAGVDWVFHLAALADIVPSIERPLLYHRSNVDGTVCVLEAARRAEVKRFVYAASASRYGLPEEFPTTEAAAVKPQYPMR